MSENNFFDKHPKTVIGVMLVFGVFFADFLMANFYKALHGESFYYKIITPAHDIEKKYRIPSSIYNHGLKANIKTESVWGPRHKTIITNSLGFKDGQIREIKKQADKYRIVFMGDSFTEGVGVDYPETFVGILDKRCQDRYEILNAGVVSYAPTVYYLKSRYFLEDYGLKFNEMIVLVDISDINDEVENYAAYPTDALHPEQEEKPENALDKQVAEISAKRKWQDFLNKYIKTYFRENSILYGIPRFFKNRKFNADAQQVNLDFIRKDTWSIDNRKSLWTVDDKYYKGYGEAGLKKAKLNIKRLKALLDKHHIKLTLAVYPWPAQIFYNDLDSIQVREWRKFCQENGIDFINLFPEFIKKGQDNRQSILDFYIPNDMHWNERGHLKVANILQSKIASLQSCTE